ncbi:PAS domain-containing protein [Bacillus sp. DNRA2]|uniref:ATP-binding protein n=1 Tax=Bacillus sp. DNRA2 TaxID=2723053 RepID=UPI00145DADA2|nr:ATP-binding protein [Bacillus sp. DNRA2]NMD72519.1 PAS domain-containing protein [Bacillus sp. DNRA2]
MSIEKPHYIASSNRLCLESGMSPDIIVRPKNFLTEQELIAKKTAYKEILSVVNFFSYKLLDSLKGTPLLIVISDSEGYLLDTVGDAAIKATVEELGITLGCLFSREDVGTNVVSLALEEGHPVKLIGNDHFHKHLFEIACYGAPFHYTDEDTLLGSICIMMPITFQNPMFLSILSQAVDTIERELLLRKQNRALSIMNQVMLSSSKNGIIMTDENGVTTEINAIAEKILNINSETDLGTSIYDSLLIGTYFKSVIETEEIIENIELKFTNANGEQIVCLFDAQRIYEGDKVIGAFGRFRDITDRCLMEKKIKENEKRILAGQIAAGIAHEIRNPLTTVRGYLQFLEKTVDTNTAQLFTSLLIPEIDRANKIISDFLRIAKPTTKEFEILQVHQFLIDYLWKFLESEALLHTIEINLDIHPDTDHLIIHCNREELLQVFMNLFQNSIQAKGHRPLAINIRTKVVDSSVQFIFSDNGKGIHSSDLARIFEPFFSTKDIGTGLGLSISQKIIENHNGTIQAISNEHGTEFIIELPYIKLH